MKEFKTRGLLFTTLAEWLENSYPEESRRAVKQSLSAGTLELLETASKGGWYPLKHLVEILRCCQAEKGKALRSCMDFGNYLCELSLSTSFKGLIVFIDPVTLVKRVPLFWERYFNAGRMRAEKVSEGQAVLSLEDPLDEDTVIKLFSGWLEHALTTVGARNVEINGTQSRWELSWLWSA